MQPSVELIWNSDFPKLEHLKEELERKEGKLNEIKASWFSMDLVSLCIWECHSQKGYYWCGYHIWCCLISYLSFSWVSASGFTTTFHLLGCMVLLLLKINCILGFSLVTVHPYMGKMPHFIFISLYHPY